MPERNELIGHLSAIISTLEAEREAHHAARAEVALAVVELERMMAAFELQIDRLKTVLTGTHASGRPAG